MAQVSKMKRVVGAVGVLALAGAGIVALGGWLGAEPSGRIDDVVQLEFVVVDAQTSLPVKDAEVRLIDPFEYRSDDGDDVVFFQNEQGKVVVARDFDLGELLNDVPNGGQIKALGWRVNVSAKGYTARTIPLCAFTGELIDKRNPAVKDAVIRLNRDNSRRLDSSLRCETFFCRDFGSRSSLVISGEKFDALLSCPKLCSEHTPWFEVKLGEVHRVDGTLQLIVQRQERIRGRDGEEFPWLGKTLIPVRWGQRQYLVGSEQFIAFCNAVNLGDEPRDSEWGDFYLGEGQEDIRVTGQPEVPARWSPYLLKEPVQGEVIELAGDSKAKVNLGRKHGLRVGMKLVPIDVESVGMEVVSVDEGQCLVEITHGGGVDLKNEVAAVVSTRRPPRRLPTR
jgi:hypothetical protein